MSEEGAPKATPTVPNITNESQLSGKAPNFGGGTGGLLSKAFLEEKYAITWNSPKEQVFEIPTGGAATMHQGDNLLYLARKEYCIALGGQQLRSKFKITNYKIYRVFPNGDVEYLHPKDGVFPEKVNAGRVAVGSVPRRIGENPDPVKLKFSSKKTYEA
ncbi:photosystem I reaction center subunit II PsaD [Merismopedia glauca]|uniref:Photosystem I reaction center subunit II n=1 Tax=Merismopedia glauca CCAP 1448/3 TaxID=1296344 RepID=A0A2T1C5B7_9CYAN|nr:photosystem I reaction center subunit II PsaD [Merismopedia glauca]PSB03475.1 Photosystem I reaction center subunit II [Merismopedia glauca CCAP 1448/3]